MLDGNIVYTAIYAPQGRSATGAQRHWSEAPMHTSTRMYALQRRSATKAQSSTGRPWRIAAGAHTYGWKYALVLRHSSAAALWRCAPVAHICP